MIKPKLKRIIGFCTPTIFIIIVGLTHLYIKSNLSELIIVLYITLLFPNILILTSYLINDFSQAVSIDLKSGHLKVIKKTEEVVIEINKIQKIEKVSSVSIRPLISIYYYFRIHANDQVVCQISCLSVSHLNSLRRSISYKQTIFPMI